VDLWLNTPQFPLEASGTSGMKAALNGVPSLSILDGWWVEGHIEGVTGWCIGESRRTAAGNTPADNTAEAESLYNKLEGVILPMYYNDRAKFLESQQHAIAITDRSSIRSGWVQHTLRTRICVNFSPLDNSPKALLRFSESAKPVLYIAHAASAPFPFFPSAEISRRVLMLRGDNWMGCRLAQLSKPLEICAILVLRDS